MGDSDDVSRTLKIADLISEQHPGTTYYVSASTGNDANDGKSWDYAKRTIGSAVSAAVSLDRILIEPGTYDESVVIPNSKTELQLVGVGPRLAVAVAPSATNATALTVHADDVEAINIDFAGQGTGGGALITGRRFHDVRCKFEGGTDCFIIGPGSVADINASLAENGSDSLSEDSEFAWSANGVVLQGSDYGAATENRFVRPRFHNLTGAHFTERHSAGGANALHYESLEVRDALHDTSEDGTAPTKFYDLDDDNANSGIVTGCRLPTAINSGLNLVSTKLIWVGNYHTGGLSGAQPS